MNDEHQEALVQTFASAANLTIAWEQFWSDVNKLRDATMRERDEKPRG